MMISPSPGLHPPISAENYFCVSVCLCVCVSVCLCVCVSVSSPPCPPCPCIPWHSSWILWCVFTSSACCSSPPLQDYPKMLQFQPSPWRSSTQHRQTAPLHVSMSLDKKLWLYNVSENVRKCLSYFKHSKMQLFFVPKQTLSDCLQICRYISVFKLYPCRCYIIFNYISAGLYHIQYHHHHNKVVSHRCSDLIEL